jgi:tripartite-type tricarboxylate transporter receptor subunit TctC
MYFKKTWLAGVLGLGLSLTAQHVLAQAGRYPEKPVRLVVGYAPGGLPDTIARVTGQKLGERWGQQVIVDNRPGANSSIAAEHVAKQPADGYSLLVTDNSTLAINPALFKKLTYNPKDLVPVAMIAVAPLYLAAHSSFPPSTFQDMVKEIKANPGKYTYGSSGIGSTHHLCMEYLKAALGLDIVHVPFKGTGQSVPALISGQVPMVWSAYPSLSAYAKDGRVKLLAVNSSKRSPAAPNIPAVEETVKGFDFAPTIGFVAPAGISRDIVNRLVADTREAVKSKDVVDRLTSLDIQPIGSTQEEYLAAVKADQERYGRAVKISGATVD